MVFLTSSFTTAGNVMQLVGIIIVFILILVGTYYATKWIGNSGFAGSRSRNIKVIETYKISQNNFIQILKIGEKYIAVGVSKDKVDFLTELEAGSLIIEEQGDKPQMNFKDVFSKISEKHRKKE